MCQSSNWCQAAPAASCDAEHPVGLQQHLLRHGWPACLYHDSRRIETLSLRCRRPKSDVRSQLPVAAELQAILRGHVPAGDCNTYGTSPPPRECQNALVRCRLRHVSTAPVSGNWNSALPTYGGRMRRNTILVHFTCLDCHATHPSPL